jgi:flagellar motor switch protein FliG
MVTLSGLVSSFSSIEKATVLIEPGSAPKLGKAASAPSAVVNVLLRPQARMDPSLVRAIADQVAGGVAGLRPEDVRIIDSRGRSHIPSEAGEKQVDPEKIRTIRERMEGKYREAILSALSHIPGTAVTVRAEQADGHWRCAGVLVSIPRRFFTRIYRECGAAGSGPEEAVLEAVIEEQSRRIRDGIAGLMETDPGAVYVGWHFDEPEHRAASWSRTGAPSRSSTLASVWPVVLWLALGMAGGGVIAVVVVRRVRRRRRRLAWSRVRAVARRRQDRGAAVADEADAFEALRQAGVEDLVTLLSGEPAGTVALVLAHLSPARAATVLSRLTAGKQVEVARKIAEVHEMGPEAVEEARRQFSARLSQRERNRRTRPDGLKAVARILQHVGHAGRKNVLEALQQQEPELAEKIGRRLLGFEDVTQMPPEKLGPALSGLAAEELALALWTATDPLREQMMAALPPDRQEELKDATKRIGPVRLSQVESAQQRVVEAVREHEAGQLAWAAVGEGECMA